MTERPRPPGALAVVRLLAGTAVLRILRQARIAGARRRQQKEQRKGAAAGPAQPVRRAPTRRKGPDGLAILLVLMAPFCVLQSLYVAARAVNSLAIAGETTKLSVDSWTLWVLRDRGHGPDDRDAAAMRHQLEHFRYAGGHTKDRIVEHFGQHGIDGFRPAPEPFELFAGGELADDPGALATVRRGAALLLVVLGLAVLASALSNGNTDLARAQWSLTWLLTFPAPTTGIVLAKALEYSLVQPMSWFLIAPVVLQVLLVHGLGAWAVPLTIVATLANATLIGSLRLWIETWLRLRRPLRAVRNWQAALTLVSILLLVVPLGFMIRQKTGLPDAIAGFVRDLPGWLTWLPFGWSAAADDHAGPAWVTGLLLTLAVARFAIARTGGLLRFGAVASTGEDPMARRRTQSVGSRLDTVLGKDLRLLARDRTFLVQTLVVPLVLIGTNLLMNRSMALEFQGDTQAAFAYVFGSLCLTGGCFQVLSGEGRALWLLYTLPLSLADVLRAKVRLWATVAALIAWIALLLANLGAPVRPGQLVGDFVFVGAGAFVAAHVAAAIAALGTNPNADHVPRRLKVRHVYLFLFLAGCYAAPLAGDLAQRCAGLLVFGTVAYALWQRLRDRIPYLLDPVAEDRSGFQLFHAGAALVTFALLQVISMLILVANGVPTGLAVLIAFALAGALTMAAIRGIFLLQGVPFRPADRAGGRPVARATAGHPAALLSGVLGGLACAAAALGWLALVHRFEWFAVPASDLGDGDRLAIALLAIVAAPLLEEPLFRGMVFRSLATTVALPLAICWSAALFAVLHPMVSWPPVFLLGVTTAFLLHRTGRLTVAIAAHVVYNAIVVLGNQP